jgi:DMSO/TMAO reductase YedYZ molybdopterin-dependent catalytic subunit
MVKEIFEVYDMKKLLIILFAILLISAGCSQDAADAPITNEISDTNEINNKISEEIDDSNEPEAEESEKSEEPVSEKPSEEAEEAAKKEEPTEEISEQEKPIREEVLEDNPVEEETEIIENALKIKGLAEKELSLTLDELKAMNDIIFEADFYSLNNFGTTGYTHFKGVKLWDLLENEALIKPEASKISIIAQDGYSMEFTIEQVQMEYMDETNPDNKYPIIIAWEENGEEYSLDEGNPYKLVVGQKEPGDINKPQWVSNIDVILIE